MRRVTTVVIGAGQAGLATSRCLSERSIDHVVLERDDVASSWRTGKWDSLRLLTPRWQSRLPGWQYEGDDPDGFMKMPEVVAYLSAYASSFGAPVERAAVTSVSAADDGFDVLTSSGPWRARSVVIASGPYQRPDVPALSAAVPSSITSLTPDQYRNPSQLDEGGVLVVGAAATGVQLADEIQRSGRAVTLAVGSHVRLPRTYRGLDVMRWLDGAGVLSERWDEVDDVDRARNVASFQLAGTPEHRTIDLSALSDAGVRLVGRLAGITPEGVAQFSGSLPNVVELADLKLNRLLGVLDQWAGFPSAGEVERFEPTRLLAAPPLLMSLTSGEIKTIIWATGFKPEYPWLDVPVLDRKGRIRHDGGVTPCPGLYLIGMNVLRRRNSGFIDGVGRDAVEVVGELAGHLDGVTAGR